MSMSFLSYITSRCGEVKSVSEVETILKELFESMYDLEYREEIEIRPTGWLRKPIPMKMEMNIPKATKEPYEYKKLIVTLHKGDGHYPKVFADYPDNLKH